MTDRVLFVDDEPNVLHALERKLRNRFDVSTAESGEEGLRVLRTVGPFGVVVSDMRMPGMDGTAFLGHARREFPETVQIILSGQSDLESMIAAVNDGNVFRFLTKPCNDASLLRGVEAAFAQHRLLRVEREVLERTLGEVVQVLTEVLELARPEAFGRCARIREVAEALGARLGIRSAWQLRLAAMLSQLGSSAVPFEALAQIRAGAAVGDDERAIHADHPRIAAKLLSRIPRLEGVARIVEAQDGRPESHAGTGADDARAVEALRAVVHLVEGEERGRSREETFAVLAGSTSPEIVAALRELDLQGGMRVASIAAEQLRVGMVLDQDVASASGLVLARKGGTVTEMMLLRIDGFRRGKGIEEPIRAFVPSRGEARPPDVRPFETVSAKVAGRKK